MKKMKYVLNENTGHFLLFPSDNGMTHSDVCMVEKWTNAGFVCISEKDGTVECFGESVSLGIKTGNRDSIIINHGINGFF